MAPNNPLTLFGFEIKRKEQIPASFAPPINDDGAINAPDAGGIYGTYVDLDGAIRTEAELVTKYREMSQHPEVDSAIDDIVNEVIIQEPETKVVELVLDELDNVLTPKIKDILQGEFEGALELLEFNQLSYEVFRRWYIDGRLYYHAIIDESNPKEGIKELRYIDPRKIRKVRQIKTKRANVNVPIVQTGSEYYLYNDKGFAKTSGSTAVPSNNVAGLRIAKDSIIHSTSGLMSINNDLVQSYLHKAIKPLNQLRSMEDSLVIYRISRAPERRIFYINVGNLPKMKAEQYLRDTMARFKNKIVYDSATGEIRDDRKFMTMLEDFWLPRRDDGKGTEITTLPGGQNLGQMDDVIYFQKKLYKSLNVPISRLEPENIYTLGRGAEISRDEVKFSKFIARLRYKFAILFLKIMERQVILKGIMTPEDWDSIKNKMNFKFAKDNYYAELKEGEILNQRIATMNQITPLIGKAYSWDWVRRHVLRQTDEDIEEIDKQIEAELSNPILNPPVDPSAPGAPTQGPASGNPQLTG